MKKSLHYAWYPKMKEKREKSVIPYVYAPLSWWPLAYLFSRQSGEPSTPTTTTEAHTAASICQNRLFRNLLKQTNLFR